MYNTSKKRNEKLDELRLVGKKKVIGYLSLSTLKACGKTMDEMIHYAKQNQIQYLFIKNEENACYRGHLYFYHEKTLHDILVREQVMLKNAHIPSHSTEQFITYIGNHHVRDDKYPQAYRLIGKLFNDKRFKKIKKLK